MTTLEAALKQALAVANPETDSAHDIAHSRRVWTNAQQIAKGENQGDLKILIAAAYLHDLVNLPKDHQDRKSASRLSATAAAPILSGLKFSTPQIKAVQHAIETHSYSAQKQPETTEAKILQDSDRLEALGAIGIARTFAVSGTLNRPLFDPEDPFAKTRHLDDRQFAIDHWPLKLLRLPDLMNTKTGKDIANKRCKTMYHFLADLAQELDTEITSASPFFLS